MIKILGICGSPVKQGNVEIFVREALSHICGQEGVETEVITLAGKNISGCSHCNWCIRKQSEGKFCVQEDDMQSIYPKVLEADGIILATPVHFGRLSGMMANMIDRLRVFVHGSLYGGRLRNKIGGALAVAFFRGGGVETTLASINSAFFIFQMIIATSRKYQLGAAAFSTESGTGGVNKGVHHMVLEDEFGITSARLLAERMLELARIVQAGERALNT